MAIPGFIFGPGQQARTPEELARMRRMADSLASNAMSPRNIGEGLSAIGQALMYRSMMGKLGKAESAGRSGAIGKIANALAGSGSSAVPAVDPNVSTASAAKPSDGASNLPSRFDFANAEKGKDGSTYASFMGEVGKSGLTNPYGLAAVAATGRAESGWSPTNVAGSWSDPSQSGKAGTAGGAMSWRNERLAAMRDYARSNNLDPTDPTTQAKFFMQEDPTLVAGLQNAKSVEEAQGLINNAWKFAGYDQPGGESARRLAYAKEYLPSFSGGGGTDTMVGSAGSDRMGGGWDWSPYAVEGATRPDSFTAMQPAFSGALEQMFSAAPPEIRDQLRVGSGYRSPERQAELWQDALKKYGSPEAARKWVAPPGNSQHNHGAAADLKYLSDDARAWVRANAEQYGLAFPLSNEPWHIELATARDGGAPTSVAGGAGSDQMLGGAGADTLAAPAKQRIAAALQNIAPSRFDGPGSLGDPGVQALLAAQREQQPQASPAVQRIASAFGFGGGQDPAPAIQPAPAAAGKFPPAPPAPTPEQVASVNGGSGNSRMQAIMSAISDPWTTDEERALLTQELAYERKQQDPVYQMELEKSRMELEAMRNPRDKWQKLDDNTLFNPVNGETRNVGAPTGGAFRFQGNSVEAQALNGLMDSGALTAEQAQQLAAGKTISGPNNELIFMTPQGVFGQQAGQPPQPITPPVATGAPAVPQGSPPPPPVAPPAPTELAPVPQAVPPAPPVAQAPQPAPSPQRQGAAQRPGMIQLTEGKGGTKPPTEQQLRNKQLYSVVLPELGIVEENFSALSQAANQAGGALPAGSNFVTTPQFQRAKNSLRTIIATYLYSVSGATATPQEVDNQAAVLTPAAGEDQSSIDDKMSRIRNMVDAIRIVTGETSTADDLKSKYGLD